MLTGYGMVVRRWEISDMLLYSWVMWLTLGEVNHVTARKEIASRDSRRLLRSLPRLSDDLY